MLGIISHFWKLKGYLKGMIKNREKINKKAKDKDNFSVFDNYTCDGQLIMVFNGEKIDIVEDTKEVDEVENCINMYI